jgi:hypothetical protein
MLAPAARSARTPSTGSRVNSASRSTMAAGAVERGVSQIVPSFMLSPPSMVGGFDTRLCAGVQGEGAARPGPRTRSGVRTRAGSRCHLLRLGFAHRGMAAQVLRVRSRREIRDFAVALAARLKAECKRQNCRAGISAAREEIERGRLGEGRRSRSESARAEELREARLEHERAFNGCYAFKSDGRWTRTRGAFQVRA